MSEKTLPLRATLKSGAGYDAPWLTVDANDPNDLAVKLDALLEGSAVQKIVEVAELFKGANSAAPLVAAPAPAPVQQQPAGWGSSNPVPSWAAGQSTQPMPAPGGPVNGTPHPEGITCQVDGVPVVYKKTPPRRSDGKSFEFWTCPNQSTKGDGHYSAFVN